MVGTGSYGRITPEDIEAAAGIQSKKPAPAPVTQAASAPAKPAAAASASLPPPLPGSRVVPFTTMQGAVSKNMMESLSVPTFRVGYPVMTKALDDLYAKVLGLFLKFMYYHKLNFSMHLLCKTDSLNLHYKGKPMSLVPVCFY